MSGLTLRRTLRLTITLLGLEPPVWRELMIDRDLTLAELHSTIALALEWPTDAHHLFTDTTPRHLRADDFGEDGFLYADHRPSRRWGDRWTMIDWRDPAVIDDATVTVGAVLSRGPIFHGCDVAGLWWCRVEAHDEHVGPAPAARARLTTGSGRAPLPGGPDPDLLPSMHAILADRSHPEHEATMADFAATVGPWTAYRPASVDLDAARLAVARRFGDELCRAGVPATGRTRLDALVDAAPIAVRGGLQQHVLHALPSPMPIDPELVGDTLRPLTWLLTVVGADGAPLVDGALAPPVLAQGAEVLAWRHQRVRDLVDRARELRLVRRFRGRLVLLASARPLRDEPLALWTHLTTAIHHVGGAPWRTPRDRSTDLLLLAVADGTLRDPAHGGARLLSALDAFEREDFFSSRASHDELAGWGVIASGVTRYEASGAGGSESDRIESRVPAVRALGALGLEHTEPGAWTVPPGLTAFALAALRSPAPRHPF